MQWTIQLCIQTRLDICVEHTVIAWHMQKLHIAKYSRFMVHTVYKYRLRNAVPLMYGLLNLNPIRGTESVVTLLTAVPQQWDH